MTPFNRYAVLLGLFVVGLAAILPAQAEQPFSFASTPGKLPKDVVPSAYRLALIPDLDKLTFDGQEEIDVVLAKATDKITLDAVGLIFKSVTLKGETGRAIVGLDAKAQTATFHFAHPLAKGSHTLVIGYAGAIPATPAGLYYNDYATAGGTKRMLVSQFESTDARRAFPGWDEPVFKATFALSVTLPKDLAVVSNMPVASEHEAGSNDRGMALKKTVFEQTPRMSSYLLVLCAGDLERIHDAQTGTDIGVWAVRGKAEQGRDALIAAGRILTYYNSYFGIPYPLPKLDLIAVPGNFSAGAMENWGGITFIDDVLLFDPKSSSESTRQRIYLVLAHEMAHQWSGDLVTMAWWNDIWLNEGFASWMDAKATDKLNPTWEFWLRQHASNEDAMAIDSRSTTHPIQVSIRDESEIDSAFDRISYAKGQAFLRMLEIYLGEDAFRDGMRRYMRKFAYSNTTTADLWSELAAASGKPVAAVAAGFTEQPGIPLIHVATTCKSGQTVASLTQDRFTINDPSARALTWQVPVQIAVVGDDPAETEKTVLVENGKASVTFEGCGKPVKANIGDVGYFRTAYDRPGFEALIGNYMSLPPADRVNFISDSWALVEAGRLEAGAYLDLTRALDRETRLVVWTEVVRTLLEIDDVERGEPDRSAFRRYALQLLRPALARVGWDAKPDENSQIGLLRATLIDALGHLGDDEVATESRRRFAAFLADPSSLAPDLRAAVFNTVGRTADQSVFDKLRELGRASSGTEEKLRYYYAIAGVRDPALLDQAIDIALTDEISNGRVNRYLIEISRQSDDPEHVWKSFLAIHAKVAAKLPPDVASRLLSAMASHSIDPAIARELRALPESAADAGSAIETKKAIESIDWNGRLKAMLVPAVSSWLQKNPR